MDADVEFFLNSQFEKIKILKQTDKGEVWLVQKKTTGELAIMKKINFSGLPYNILKKNPNNLWAKIFLCVESENQTVVVEEFLSGENLEDKKIFITENDAKKYLLQLCDGLKILHSLGIIHRDIKPSNLILQNEKIIRLIDFDAARIFKAEKNSDTKTLGTKNYAPPEQFGFGQTDFRSDIFSLGKTFQELLGENLHGNLKKILQKCTELDPANRFQTVDELKSALLEKKTFQYKKILEVISLSIILILVFQQNAKEETINLPVEIEEVEKVEEKISEVKEEKISEIPQIKFPEIKIPAETFQTPQKFPEIKLPEISQPEKNLPAKIIPEKTEESQQKIYADYVRVKYYFKGTRMNAWTDDFEQDITNVGSRIEVKNLSEFQKIGESLKFPAWNIEVKVENYSDKNFVNPQLEIIYNDNGRIEKKILHGSTILAGNEINFKIPMNQFKITNPISGKNQTLELKFTGNGVKIFGSEMKFDFIL